jgi:hypothetical protein
MRLTRCIVLLLLFIVLASNVFAVTTWYVNGLTGSDSNNCLSSAMPCKTIGHGISLASSGDSIKIASATYSANPTIGINLTLAGSSALTTIIDGGGKGTVISVSSGVNVVLSQLTIQNGSPSGIYNVGMLKITNSTIRNNFVLRNCISYCIGVGAGIRNVGSGVITIRNSTIANNSIHVSCSGTGPYCFAYGGGISNEGGGKVTIVNSTLSGNVVVGTKHGLPIGCCGAIAMSLDNQTSLAIYSSTIVGNSATSIGGIVGVTTVISNSIVANNVGGNCSSYMVSKGYNLSSDNSCMFSGVGDLNNTNPKLGNLGSYGGPTQTIPLLSGSPAIDAGNPNGCADASGNVLKTDQRGMPRHDPEDAGGCDMGAFEKQSD